MDNIYEQGLKANYKNAQTKYFMFMMISIVAGFVGVALTGMGITTENSFIIPGVLLFLLAVFLWFKKDSAYTEYEYSFVCGSLEIARIINNSRRKELTKIECDKIEVIGYANQDNYLRYSSMPGVKKINATFIRNKRASNLCFAFFISNKGKILLHFEPDEQMMFYIKRCIKVRFGG